MLVAFNTLKKMEQGTVKIDAAIDQGRCLEISHPTATCKQGLAAGMPRE